MAEISLNCMISKTHGHALKRANQKGRATQLGLESRHLPRGDRGMLGQEVLVNDRWIRDRCVHSFLKFYFYI